MDKILGTAAGLLLLIAIPANAQSLSGKVTGAVGGLGASVSGASGTSASGGGSNPFSVLADPVAPAAGGDLSGGYGVKMGGRTVTLRGAVGVGDDRAFRAGAGVPF